MSSESAWESEILATQFRREGYYVREHVVDLDTVENLREMIAALPERDEVRRRQRVYGVRNLFELSAGVRELASHPSIRACATCVLGNSAFAARAVFFDKSPDANWSLFWHQDNVIAVRERIDVEGFTAWSQKSGVWQTQPPAEVLTKMIAIRVHLDDCRATNGALRVLPGSHRHGWLDDELDDWKRRVPEQVCEVGCGGVVAICPLTLHASAASQTLGRRRVIHIEFAADDLPAGLQWKHRIGGSRP